MGKGYRVVVRGAAADLFVSCASAADVRPCLPLIYLWTVSRLFPTMLPGECCVCARGLTLVRVLVGAMPEYVVGVQMRKAAWAAVLLAPRVDLA